MITSVPIIGVACVIAAMTLASSMHAAWIEQEGVPKIAATKPMSDTLRIALATLVLVACACLNLCAPLLQHDYSLEELSNIFIESSVTASEKIEPT